MLRPQPQRDTGPQKGHEGNQAHRVLTSSELKVLHATESAPRLSRLFLRIITMVRPQELGSAPGWARAIFYGADSGRGTSQVTDVSRNSSPLAPHLRVGLWQEMVKCGQLPGKTKKGRLRDQDGGRSGPSESCPLLHAVPASLLKNGGGPQRPDHLLGGPWRVPEAIALMGTKMNLSSASGSLTLKWHL